MLRQFINRINGFYKKYPSFFYLYCVVFLLYFFQIITKIEITPLGYFSLYSQPMHPQTAYEQILPFNLKTNLPINIYESNGGAFLPLEILPTRLEILGNKKRDVEIENLRGKIGYSASSIEIKSQEAFKKWYYNYCISTNVKLPEFQYFELRKCYFKNGNLMSSEPLKIQYVD